MVKRPFQTYRMIKDLTDSYFKALQAASEAKKPIAWGPADMPYEILRAMDIYYVLGEPYGAICSAQGMSSELLPVTENYGFRTRFCAYSRNFIGSYLTGKGPFGKLQRPSFMIGTRVGCNDHIAWFEALSKILERPFFSIDIPFCYENPEERHILYVQRQLENLVDFLEGITKSRMDEERLISAVINAYKLRETWRRIIEKMKIRPAPLNFRSQSSFMVTAVWLKGSKEAVEVYCSLLEEIDDRIKGGIPSIEDEKARLLWDNVPMWFYLKAFNYLEEKGLIPVISPYMLGWGDNPLTYSPYRVEVIDLLKWKSPQTAQDALREMAKQFLRIQITTNSLDSKIRLYEGLARDYCIDGAIFHSNWGCKHLSLNRTEVAKYLEETLHIPILIFESSMADPSGFDENVFLSRIDKFALEILP
jgi:benzoyl-CoA reductase/2-hydroxyglutaryl-CoA dehydratase subunit BcrC/BadD/HgdB